MPLLKFAGVVPGHYFIVVGHRNHVSVMSPIPVDFTSAVGSWAFPDSMGAAYTIGPSPMKNFGDGKFGMFACDINSDGQITVLDFNVWLPKTKAAATGYESSDCGLERSRHRAGFQQLVAEYQPREGLPARYPATSSKATSATRRFVRPTVPRSPFRRRLLL